MQMEALLSSIVWSVLGLLVTAGAILAALWWFSICGYISFQNGWPSLKPVNLPPGTMGWPVIGETLEYLKDSTSFSAERWRRYGEIYKTHLLGWPTVVTTSAEAYKFVMLSKAEELRNVYPKVVTDIVGPNYVNYLWGEVHSRVRKLPLRHLLPGGLRDTVAGIEEEALITLNSWASGSTIPAFRFAVEEFTLGVGMYILFGSESRTPEARELSSQYTELERGFTTIIPINLPGTQWRKSLQSRQRVLNTLKGLIERRLAKRKMAQDSSPHDMLDSFLKEADPSQQDPLNYNMVADNVTGLLFASNATSATTLTWILKFLHDHPPLLEAVKAEQESIKGRKAMDEPLTWDDLKDMSLTYKVTQEALRIADLLYDVVTREAVVDVEYKGFVIPRGWRVKPVVTHFHMDPQMWPEPNKFDPSRFEELQRGALYAPFGAGEHLCVGNELARVEVLVFMHHFITQFRWQVLEDGPTTKLPLTSPYKGLPVKITRIQ